MASFFQFLNRLYTFAVNPPTVPKSKEVLKVGLLGASTIAPLAVILPARSHPEVSIYAVAARDKTKAEAYAKKHNIPVVHKSYEDILADPAIDVIYIALPNGLHYEWALRSLKAGKHVLLEKPSCSNSIEAKSLFTHPLATSNAPNAPVLLEAFHYRFHPAWQEFLAILKHDPLSGPIEKVAVTQTMFKYFFSPTDIRFDYGLAGGTLMDFGTYGVSAIRGVFATEPEEVVAAKARTLTDGHRDKEIDEAMNATYRFPNGAIATLYADLRTPSSWWNKLPGGFQSPHMILEMAEKELADGEGAPRDGSGGKRFVKRKMTFWNFMMPTIYHRIDIVDTHIVRKQDGMVVKTWKDERQEKFYVWKEKGEGKVGEEWWSTYRFQLEEFVNRIKGRKGSGVWVDYDESIKQMELIDKTYQKAGLSLRPTSQFKI